MDPNENEPKPGEKLEDARIKELTAILEGIPREDYRNVYERIVEKSEELENKYGKKLLQQSPLYHIMIGSTPLYSMRPQEENAQLNELDREIEAFIRGFAKK